MTTIRGWHSHVYFDSSSIDRARVLLARAAAALPVCVGRIHQTPVGPHPQWSCQLAFGPESFAEVVSWLVVNREGLTVFTHPDTGHPLVDHRDRAIWMGSIEPLDLSTLL